MKKSDRIAAPRLWLVIAKSYRALSLLAEWSIANTGLCLTDFAALEALLHKGPLTISQIQEKVRLASGSMTAAVDRLELPRLLSQDAGQLMAERSDGVWQWPHPREFMLHPRHP